jgi:AcrR family transcriptional regulator
MAVETEREVFKGDDLKRRLVASAREILEREGLNGLSLRAAARACGVSHMAPYRHFAGKDDLLAAVAEQGFRALTAALDASALAETGVVKALEFGMAYVLFACDNPSLYRLMFSPFVESCDRNPELAAAGQEAFSRCVAAARTLGHECGLPAEGEPPPPIAAAIWSTVHGFSSLALDGLIRLPDDPAQRRDYIARTLLSALHVISPHFPMAPGAQAP